MALIERYAPPRVRRPFAFLTGLETLRKKLSAWRRERARPHIRDLTQRQARDAGVSAQELAWHHHRLPSQHNHHPRS